MMQKENNIVNIIRTDYYEKGICSNDGGCNVVIMW